MYIAFRWLLGLTVLMWMATCCMDLLIKSNTRGSNTDRQQQKEEIYKNLTRPRAVPQIKYLIYKQKSAANLHYAMFFAGALAVSIFNKKKEIILFTKKNFAKLHFQPIEQQTKLHLKLLNKTAIASGVATKKVLAKLWAKIQTVMPIIFKLFENLKRRKFELQHNNVNLLLIQRLHEVGDERKTLRKLVLALLNDNKSIKSQYQLETLTKERLAKKAEQTQSFIQENRFRYSNLHQQCLASQQENIYLKALVRKLSSEKDEAEKNLTNLICEIYKTKNSELKAYCTHFIVCSRKSLLRTDARAEIEKFLNKSREKQTSLVLQEAGSNTDALPVRSAQTWTRFEPVRVTESRQNNCTIVSLKSRESRWKGLPAPGEYVWTVKDQNGIIEKLYEYENHSNLDDGDTVRKIREYSVCYKKDCFLDYRNSSNYSNQCSNKLEIAGDDCAVLARQKFLTGSEAFQKFLRRNQDNIVKTRSMVPVSRVQCC